MGFKYIKEKRLLHLFTPSFSYIMRVNSHDIVEHLYFGKRIYQIDEEALKEKTSENFQFYENGAFVNTDGYYENISKNEFGTYLRMDLRPASFKVEQEEDALTDFRFASVSKTRHNVYPDDYPHARNLDEGTSITLKLKDARRNVYLYATYTALGSSLLKSVRIENKTRKKLVLRKVVSSTVDFDFHDQKLIHFPGHWAKERQYEEEKVHHGSIVLSSLEGRSGHFENPFFIFADPSANEEEGECYSFNLFYSGNFKNEIHLSSYDKIRINVGINDENFAYHLAKGASFLAPQVLICYSDKGYNKLSQANHDFIREHVVTSYAQYPLLFNSWEGTGMDFDEKKIEDYAKVAKSIGSELFVLDDGWFSTRNDDQHGLGDWWVNKKKVDLVKLSRYVHSLGMKFGIWMEPEMVNIDTTLYKDHPEWVLSSPDLEKRFSRNQLVLDFSNPEVVNYILNSLTASLIDANIDYVKLDMNRYLGDIVSSYTYQGEVYHKYVLGVYHFMSELLKAFPHILFENCASGGGRFDLGMLYYSPLIWCSDNTDPVDRTFIQYGTSFGYPLSTISSHVSAANGTYKAKSDVAFFGTYGFEMNPLALSKEDKAWLLERNKLFYALHQKVIQEGNLFRLASPFSDGYLAEMCVSLDQEEALLLISNVKDIDHEVSLKLEGLDPHHFYLASCKGKTIPLAKNRILSVPLGKAKETKLIHIHKGE